MYLSTLLSGAALFHLSIAGYVLEDDYMRDFYAGFDFFTDPDPTHGFVKYVDQDTARGMNLINTTAGVVNWGVDTTNPTPDGRPSIRLTSKKSYESGLVVIDVNHMPTGCGTWPAFWMVGPDWPNNGEIDILEGVNEQTNNAMTLHTGPGCTISTDGNPFSGSVETQNCDVKAQGQAENAGCSIKHPSDKSYGAGLNQAGGGVYATQWTDDAISVFFFPRDSIPADALGDSPDPSTWGTPSAKFLSAGCDIKNIFNKQQIVFDTTFCGDWAGNVWSSGSCASKAATCNDYVRDNPSAFTDAFWTINALRVYQDSPDAPAPVTEPEPPADPTPAPVDPTPAPVDPTPAPVDPTPAPVDPTPEPVDPTPAPVDPTPDPVDPTPVPSDTPVQEPSADPSNGGGFAPTPIADPTPAPVDPTPEPVDPTPAPVDPTPAPVDPTPVPSDTPVDSAVPTAPLESTLAPPAPLPSGSDTFPTIAPPSDVPSPSAAPSDGPGEFPGFNWPGKHSTGMSMPMGSAPATADPSAGGGFAPTPIDSAIPSETPIDSALPSEAPITPTPGFPLPNATEPALPGTGIATGIPSVSPIADPSAPMPSVPATTDAPTAPSDPQDGVVIETVWQTVYVTVAYTPDAPAASAAAEATPTPTPAAGGYGHGYKWRKHRHQKQQRRWSVHHNARR